MVLIGVGDGPHPNRSQEGQGREYAQWLLGGKGDVEIRRAMCAYSSQYLNPGMIRLPTSSVNAL